MSDSDLELDFPKQARAFEASIHHGVARLAMIAIQGPLFFKKPYQVGTPELLISSGLYKKPFHVTQLASNLSP